MPGRIDSKWSPWPQLTLATAKGVQPGTEEYTKAILSTYGADALKTSWIQLGLEEFLAADVDTKNKLKDIGCFIVRQVVSEKQATDWYHELKGYVEENKTHITGTYSISFV
ncbi:hypothetical protein E4T44_02910 [Aureobasidium sp. EXF-8845]|nr:hypothetical protein E4T44_02910 [Aureobasidium sp. EXF-8845]KAI4855621.1 hypothetical protein E4T45_02939 [Aureobasidium sp. EXF-8846]